MKVSIRKIDEKEGLIFKKAVYTLYVGVQLTQDEVSALKAAGVEDYVLVEYTYKNLELNWTVSGLLYDSKKGGERRFVAADQVERSQLESQIKESLAQVKQVIDSQDSLGESEESFEL